MKLKFFINLLILFMLIVVGCNYQEIQNQKDIKAKENQSIKVEKDLISIFNKNMSTKTLIQDKCYIDYDNDGLKDLVIAYFDLKQNTKTNVAFISGNGVMNVIDLANKDRNFQFSNEKPLITKIDEANIKLPLYSTKLKKVIDYKISIISEPNHGLNFKIDTTLTNK